MIFVASMLVEEACCLRYHSFLTILQLDQRRPFTSPFVADTYHLAPLAANGLGLSALDRVVTSVAMNPKKTTGAKLTPY